MSNVLVSSIPTDQEEFRIHVDSLLQDIDYDLFYEGSSSPEHYLELGVPLYRAALEGDWKAADKVLRRHPYMARARITKTRETALHIAAAAKRRHFVKQLVKIMSEDELALQNENDNTALCFAAASNNVEIARVMVEKNRGLPMMQGNHGMTPLYMATLLGHRDMAWYLLSVTDFDALMPLERLHILITSINSNLYDVALEILEEFLELAIMQDANRKTALHYLARNHIPPASPLQHRWLKWICTCFNHFVGRKQNVMSSDEAPQLVRTLWEGIIRKMMYNDIAYYYGAPPSQLLFDAAAIGNIEFIKILIGSYPDFIWKINEEGVSIFHVAVLERQTKVFNLIYEIGAIKDLLATYEDKDGNNMLHMAAMSPPSASLDSVSGAALKMQKELLWYKEVENVVQPQFRESKNKAQQTPQSLFTKEHETLRKDGEEWMKKTAESCSLVAALIATVAFTAAFTVPGGNDQEKGTPIFQRDPIFVAFAIVDAISLFSSSISMLMFLGILTSRYAEKDFLVSLPLKLLMGLSSLFLSITCMMVAFAVTFFIIFKDGVPSISIPIAVAALAVVPVVLFAFGQFPLLIDICRSTYQTRNLFRPNQHKVFRENKNGHLLKRLVLKFLGKED